MAKYEWRMRNRSSVISHRSSVIGHQSSVIGQQSSAALFCGQSRLNFLSQSVRRQSLDYNVLDEEYIDQATYHELDQEMRLFLRLINGYIRSIVNDTIDR